MEKCELERKDTTEYFQIIWNSKGISFPDNQIGKQLWKVHNCQVHIKEREGN